MSVGHLANRAAVNLLDQDELARYRIGKTKLGGKILGRSSARLGGEVDKATLDGSTKALQQLEKNGFGREAHQVLAGDYRKFDAETITRLTNAGFIDSKTGVMRSGTSLQDFDSLSGILQASSDGKLREAGLDIATNRGYLANLKTSDPETAYADTQAIGLMGMMATGYGGSAADFAQTANHLTERLGSSGALVVNQAQKIGRQSRPDLRDRYGLTVVSDGVGGVKYQSGYEEPMSNTAVSSIITLKGQDWTPARGEAVKDTAATYIALANGSTEAHYNAEADKFAEQYLRTNDKTYEEQSRTARAAARNVRDQQQNIKGVIAYGANNIYADPGAMREWQNIAIAAKIDAQTLAKGKEQVDRVVAQTQAGGAGGGDGGTTASGAETPTPGT